jgi:hypothetical protein
MIALIALIAPIKGICTWFDLLAPVLRTARRDGP